MARNRMIQTTLLKQTTEIQSKTIVVLGKGPNTYTRWEKSVLKIEFHKYLKYVGL